MSAAPLDEHGGPVRALALSADGTRMASGGFDYSVIVWDAVTGTMADRHTAHEAPVSAIAQDSLGHVWSGDQAGDVVLWSTEGLLSAPPRADFSHRITQIVASGDRRLIAAASWDGRVMLWGADPLVRMADFQAPAPITSLNFTASETLIAADRDGQVFVLHQDDGGLAVAHRFETGGLGITAIAATADGAALLTAHVDGGLRLWSLPDGSALAERQVERTPLLAVEISDDGTQAITGGGEGYVQLWNLEPLEVVRSWKAHADLVFQARFNSEGHVYTAGGDGMIRHWDTDTGELFLGPPLASSTRENQAGPRDRGETVFAKCAACHSVQADDRARAGPHLEGLFGRKAGSVAGYPYSDALKASDIVWTEETVAELFARGPHLVTPGSKMPLQRMPDPDDRDALIAYLKKVTR